MPWQPHAHHQQAMFWHLKALNTICKPQINSPADVALAVDCITPLVKKQSTSALTCRPGPGSALRDRRPPIRPFRYSMSLDGLLKGLLPSPPSLKAYRFRPLGVRLRACAHRPRPQCRPGSKGATQCQSQIMAAQKQQRKVRAFNCHDEPQLEGWLKKRLSACRCISRCSMLLQVKSPPAWETGA